MLPDGSGQIHLDLRHFHDLGSLLDVKNKKSYVVTQRIMTKPVATINSSFDTLPEARRSWFEKAGTLEDKGYSKTDFHISGFHEED